MEIERKFLVHTIPDRLDEYDKRYIEQGYLSTNPVVRVRRDNEDYYLTYKSGGLMVREEYNLPLNASSYAHLLKKVDGNIITKTRYEIPAEGNLVIELDLFDGVFQGLVLAEVEFSDIEAANAYQPPDWFGEEVTYSKDYHNSTLSKKIIS